MDLAEVMELREPGDDTLTQVVCRISRERGFEAVVERKLRLAASAMDCYERAPQLQEISGPILKDPYRLIEHLKGIRGAIPKRRGEGTYGLCHLVKALKEGGKIPGENHAEFAFIASATEFFDANPSLQQTPDEVLKNPIKLVAYLKETKGSLNTSSGQPNSLSYTILALIAGKKIPRKRKKDLMLLAGAAEYYDVNSLLQDIPSDVLNDRVALLEYLAENREAMTSPEGKEHNSLIYLIRALYVNGKIEQGQYVQIGYHATAADYAMQRREMIEAEITRAYDELTLKPSDLKEREFAIRKVINRDKFTHLRNAGKQVCRTYFNNIIKYAMLFYGNKAIGRTP